MTRSRRRAILGYLWISPWLLGFVIFQAGPMVGAFLFSFTRYDIVSPPEWLWFQNYVYAFTTDPLFWRSLQTTLYYILITVPIGIICSLGVALLLNQGRRSTTTYRTLFFLPNLTPIVAVAVLWSWIFHPQFGPLNYLLSLAGLPTIGWLGSTFWAIPSLAMIALWHGIGGNRMVIFLAGLQSVPSELFEAAVVDGAGTWARFRHITLPMISPTIFFNVTLAIIYSLRVFETAFLTTAGGPNYATWFYMLHLYYAAFRDFDMGYASALAMILFALTLTLTWIQFKFANRWVYYEGEVERGT